MSRLVRMAQLFAQAAHGATGQYERAEETAKVVGMLKAAGVTEAAPLCAAWLYDVVEDSAVTLSMIVRQFGAPIGLLVQDLTEAPADVMHPMAKTVRIAQLITGASEHDPKYRAEALALLDVLRDCSHPSLWRQLEEELSE